MVDKPTLFFLVRNNWDEYLEGGGGGGGTVFQKSPESYISIKLLKKKNPNFQLHIFHSLLSIL